MSWDAIVVGAGPAGSAAALVLARSGYRTAIVERCAMPRPKACGDALTWKAIRVLDELDVLSAVRTLAQPIDRIRVEAGGRSASFSVACLTLTRSTLDATLLALACAAGARMFQGEVMAVEQEAGGVMVWLRQESEQLRGRFAILATGSAGTDRAGGRKPSPKPYAFALRGYARMAGAAPGEMVLTFGRDLPGGYAWLFPLARGVVNVGVGTSAKLVEQGTNLRQALDRFLQSESGRAPFGPLPLGALDGLKGASIRCALRGRLPPVQGRVLAAGDAVGSTYPFTGEGISTALWTGWAAGEAVARALAGSSPECVQDYALRLAREQAPRYRKYLITERLLARPTAMALIVRLLGSSARLKEIAHGLSTETRGRRVEVP